MPPHNPPSKPNPQNPPSPSPPPSPNPHLDALLHSHLESSSYLAAADAMLPELHSLDPKRQEMLLDWLDSRPPSSLFEQALREAMEEAGIEAVGVERVRRVERWKGEWERRNGGMVDGRVGEVDWVEKVEDGKGEDGMEWEGGQEVRREEMGVGELVEAVDDLEEDGERKWEEGDMDIDGDDEEEVKRGCKRRWVGDVAIRGKTSGGSGT